MSVLNPNTKPWLLVNPHSLTSCSGVFQGIISVKYVVPLPEITMSGFGAMYLFFHWIFLSYLKSPVLLSYTYDSILQFWYHIPHHDPNIFPVKQYKLHHYYFQLCASFSEFSPPLSGSMQSSTISSCILSRITEPDTSEYLRLLTSSQGTRRNPNSPMVFPSR